MAMPAPGLQLRQGAVAALGLKTFVGWPWPARQQERRLVSSGRLGTGPALLQQALDGISLLPHAIGMDRPETEPRLDAGKALTIHGAPAYLPNSPSPSQPTRPNLYGPYTQVNEWFPKLC